MVNRTVWWTGEYIAGVRISDLEEILGGGGGERIEKMGFFDLVVKDGGEV